MRTHLSFMSSAIGVIAPNPVAVFAVFVMDDTGMAGHMILLIDWIGFHLPTIKFGLKNIMNKNKD